MRYLSVACLFALFFSSSCSRNLSSPAESRLANTDNESVAGKIWNQYGDIGASAIRQTVKIDIFVEGEGKESLQYSGSGMIVDRNHIVSSANILENLSLAFNYDDVVVPVEYQYALIPLKGRLVLSDFFGDEVYSQDFKLGEVVGQTDPNLKVMTPVTVETLQNDFLSNHHGKNISFIKLPNTDLGQVLGVNLVKVDFNANRLSSNEKGLFSIGYGSSDNVIKLRAFEIGTSGTLLFGSSGRNKNVYARLPFQLTEKSFINTDVGGPLIKLENGKIQLIGVIGGTEIFENGSFLSQFLGGGKFKAELFTSLEDPDVKNMITENNFSLMSTNSCPE